jgi:uncharacterized protein (DUF1800 family)
LFIYNQLIEKNMRNLNLWQRLSVSSLLLLISCGGELNNNKTITTNKSTAPSKNIGGIGNLDKNIHNQHANKKSNQQGNEQTTRQTANSNNTTTIPRPTAHRRASRLQLAPPPDPASAARFLSQATFGPNAATIAQVTTLGYDGWINDQFKKQQVSHRLYMERISATLPAGVRLHPNQFYESFWQQVVNGEDQLRQRVTFALSEIFVISFASGDIGFFPRGAASYYDMLGQNAFGNYRDVLEAVSIHPSMGIYLSHVRNQKESGERVPDENYAREIMQLFSIGLYQLNQDGSLKLSNGKPSETYTHDDVAALAKVFTGWSWAGPDKSQPRFYGGLTDPDRDWKPMQNYPLFHSTSDKTFLGTIITGATTGESDLKTTIDTLFNHPNVGPFIGRQLIQRLVTSNPSPAYIGRVAAAFANNGAGVRGDMRSVISAILLDPEARSSSSSSLASSATSDKLREPVIRLANWMRAFNVRSASGRFLLSNMDDPLTNLGQTPLRAPSVFNYYRPGYTPPNTGIASAGMVAPEMQTTAEPSVIGYLNFIQRTIQYGVGGYPYDVTADYSAEVALAATPDALVDHVNLLLTNNTITAVLRQQILTAINSVGIPQSTDTNAAAVARAKNNRVYLAIFLTMASTEYLIQK